jgi:hypothetical protein
MTPLRADGFAGQAEVREQMTLLRLSGFRLRSSSYDGTGRRVGRSQRIIGEYVVEESLNGHQKSLWNRCVLDRYAVVRQCPGE